MVRSHTQGPGLKPPIEPLAASTWQAIETRVFDRLERPAPQPAPRTQRAAIGLAVSGLAASALAAGALALLLPLGGERVQPLQAPTTSMALPAAAPLPPPALEAPPVERSRRIETAGAPSEEQLGDSRLRIAEHSALAIQGSDADGWRVQLVQGEVDCEVAPRAGRPAFVVSTADAEVRVIGTRFDVIRRGNATRVRVRSGHVQVRHGGQLSELGPGDHWPLAPRRGEPGPASPEPAKPADTAQREFERAARLEASDPTRALELYRRISNASGPLAGSPWAANALYARARLSFERGELQEAKALSARYLEKYPKGANAADAQRLLESSPTR